MFLKFTFYLDLIVIAKFFYELDIYNMKLRFYCFKKLSFCNVIVSV